MLTSGEHCDGDGHPEVLAVCAGIVDDVVRPGAEGERHVVHHHKAREPPKAAALERAGLEILRRHIVQRMQCALVYACVWFVSVAQM